MATVARRLVARLGRLGSRLRLLRLDWASSRSSSRAASTRPERPRTDAAALVLELAERKALAVANGRDDLVLGCDSLLDLDGVALGKPGTAEEALSGAGGRCGVATRTVLRTGHVLIDGAERRDGRRSGLDSRALRVTERRRAQCVRRDR